MLLVCPVRPGDSNEELRYALRSWETNLHLSLPSGARDGLALMTVGYRPNWLDPDVHIPGNHYKSIQLAVFDNIRLVSEEAARLVDDSASVIYMNDDFFCLDPVGSILPVRRNCSLADHIAKFPPNAGLWWPRSLRLTASWLAEQGWDHPWSYEAHRPLLANPRLMAQTLNMWHVRPDSMKDTVPQWRTIYGVMNEIEAYPVIDAKLGTTGKGYGTPWVSTSDQTWRRYAPDIKKRFRKPSRWEITQG